MFGNMRYVTMAYISHISKHPNQPWSYRKLTTKRLICFLLFDQTAQTISARDKQLRESELNGADDITTPASSQSMVGNYNYSGSASDSHRDAGCNNNPFILLQTPPSHPKLSNFTRDNMFVFYWAQTRLQIILSLSITLRASHQIAGSQHLFCT